MRMTDERNPNDSNDQFQKAREYWRDKFETQAPEINLPCDFERSLDFKREQYPLQFPPGLSGKLLSLSKKQDLLLYTVLLAALNVLIFKYTGKQDISIGAPVYTDPGEPAPDHETLMVFREFIHHHMTFKELLLDVKETLIDGYENQHYVIENMLDVMGVAIPVKLLSRVILVLDGFHREQTVHTVVNSIDNDLALTISKSHSLLSCRIGYNAKLFKPDTIQRLGNHYLHVLGQAVNDLNVTLSHIELLPDEEKERILSAFNDTAAPYPRDKTIHALFEEHARQAPGTIAAVFGERQLTYGELDKRANRLAAVLISKGSPRIAIVGLMVERSIEMVTGIIGILKTGAAYLPLDPQFPKERTRYMLADSDAKLLVSTRNLREDVKQLSPPKDQGEIETVYINLTQSPPHSTGHEQPPNRSTPTPSKPAYIIYTSGTTGKPKGAVIQHKGIVSLNNHWGLELEVGPGDRVLEFFKPTFDASVLQIFMALLNRASLHLVEEDIKSDYSALARYLERHRITHAGLPPAFLSHVDTRGNYALKLMMSGGATTNFDLVKQWTDKSVRYINSYGPTETTICATSWSTHGNGSSRYRSVPIGKPLVNTAVYIVNTDHELQPIGVPGELYIGGSGVSGGYMNRPQLTSEKFVMFQPTPHLPPVRVYCTGDLGRWHPDGNIEFLGRVDMQVKIRGNRVEPGEVEYHLEKYPAIKEAVVIDKEDHDGEKCLCAYFVCHETVSVPQLKSTLLDALPEYMVPSYFMQLDKIPRNSNGKLDHKTLPLPKRSAEGAYAPPRNPLEETLVEIWIDVLGVEDAKAGIDSNFFELGGHSLKANRLIVKIYNQLGIKIPMAEMFKIPTIRDLAAYIENASQDNYTPLETVEKKEYYELSFNQKRLWIAYQREPGSTAYHLNVKVELYHHVDPGTIKRILTKLVARHESFRTRFRIIHQEPVQIVENAADIEIPLRVMDISAMAGEEKERRRWQEFHKAVTEPFDLDSVPLFRALLLKLDDEAYDFIMDTHHTISDGWSLDLLRGEFYGYYNEILTGQTYQPPILNVQYKDFAHWQNSHIADPLFRDKAHHYWKEKISGGLPTLQLPVDSVDSGNNQTRKRGTLYRCAIDQPLKEKLETLAATHNTTLFLVLFCAYNVLLSHVSGQDEVVTSVVSAGRDDPLLDNIVGYFVNSMIFNVHVDHEEGYTDLLRRVSLDFPEALSYQQYAIELVLGELKMKYPEIPVSFNMLNNQEGTTQQEIDSFEPRHLPNTAPIHFDILIELYASEYKNDIELNWRYRETALSPQTIESIAAGYVKLCRYITENQDQK
ncbi:MAG: amino acid adenylation domain-containing protein [bacterium]|nr:amino acid adenylation domain-containing protein [bacterium]